MNRTNNILTKIFLLLILAVGWGGTAWADAVTIESSPQPSASRFVSGTNWYTIQFNGNDSSHGTGTDSRGSYMNSDVVNSSGLMLWGSTEGSSDAAKWCFVLQSDGKYLIFNKKKGPSYVLGIENPDAGGNQNIVFYDVATAPVANTHFESVTNTGKAGNTLRVNTRVGINNSVGVIKSYQHPSNAAAGANFSLTLTLTETIHDGYRVIINGDNDYTVTTTADVNSGDKTAKDGGYLDLANAVGTSDLTSLSIDAPANKFVWGPVIDKANKTITFTIKDAVTSIASGKWYQIQVLPKGTRYFDGSLKSTEDMVNSLNSVSQMRRKSNYLYFYQDDTYSNDYPIDIAGYYQGKEAMSYVYISNVNGTSQINAAIQTVAGRYMTYQGKAATGSGAQSFKLTPESDNSFSWNGGIRPWSNLGNPSHLTLGYSGSNQGQCFYTHFAEVNPTEKYDVYKVAITGGDANAMIACSSSYNHGASQVYNGGFLFFDKAVTPTWQMFSSNVLKGVNVSIGEPDANNIRTITFTENQEHDVNVVKFSGAPSTTDWAENTTWFTWRNNRFNQNGQPTRPYISTSADYVTNNCNMTNTSSEYAGKDRGGLWCFVGTEAGFEIYNAAYGPAFLFAFVNNSYTMVPRNNVPSGAVTTFTYEYAVAGQSNWLDGASRGYVFRIGTTGTNQIHSNNTGLISWNGGGSLRKDDGGSMFKLTQVDDLELDILPELDVYYSATSGLEYTGDREVFGKRNATPYIILSKLPVGEDEIQKSDLVPSEDIESVSVSLMDNSYIKELIVESTGMFSPAPSGGTWAAGTKWFTMRNFGKSRYASTSNASIDSDMYLTWSAADTKPTDAEGMWCFVKDGGDNFRIYNKAYGPDFVFGIAGTGNESHTRMYHLSEAVSNNTHFYFVTSNKTYNGKEQQCIVFGNVSGGLNNIGGRYLGIWTTNENNLKNDNGSAFYIERVQNNVVENSKDYIAYLIQTSPNDPMLSKLNLSTIVSYNNTAVQGSKYSVNSGYYMLFDPTVNVSALPASAFSTTSAYFPEGFSEIEVGTVSNTNPTLRRITLKGNVVLSHVVHRPNGNLWRAQRNNYDGTETNTIGTQTAEYTDVTLKNGDVVKLQHTGVFEITHFLKPGESRQIWMPSTSSSSQATAKILNYMRWFDYQNETLPDLNMVDFTANQQGDVLGSAQYYQNGFVCGSSITGAYPKSYVLFKMPSDLDKSNVTYEYTLANEATRYTDYSNNFADGTTPSGGASYLGNFDDPNHKAQGNKNLVEPTIGTRQIYHIRSAHEMASKLSQCTGTKWLEEETITFPTRGVNWNNYEDVIPLEYNFLDYWAYNASDQLVNVRDGNTTIKCVFTENTLGLSVITKNANDFLDGCVGTFVESANNASREAGHYVSFDYPADGIVRIPEGKTQATATYCVYLDVNGVRYNIKKFTLVFQNNVEPVPYYEVLENDEHPRSDKSLAAQYGTTENPTGVYTQLNFHYPHNYLMGAPNAALQEGSGYYAFPYNFDEVSYSYYAAGMQWSDWGEYGMRNNAQTATRHSSLGANPYFLSVNYLRELYKKKNAEKELRDARDQLARAQDPLANFTEEEREMAQAEAQYHINRAQNTIAKQTRAVLDEAYHNNYYIYVDASEQPGQVGRLRINEPLCTGTRIYGTAWLSCATAYTNPNNSPDPASVIFRFKGVRKDGTMTTIYSYCPGQISNIGRDKNRNEVYAHDELRSDSTAYKQAIWQQCAFSFVNTYPANEFDSFVLEVFNNCRGSSGGDIFLDDIRLYIKTPQVTVDNSAPICGEELSIVRISTDFDALMDALQGSEDSERKTYYGTYAILDKDVYDNYLAKKENPTSDDVSVAFNLALMGNKKKSDCYIGEDFHSELYAFHEIQFYNELTAHQHVTYAMLVGDNILTTAGYMYQYSAAGEIISRNLVFNCKLIDQRLAGKKYYIVFQVNEVYTDMEDIPEADYHEFFSMADICCAKSEFSTMRAKMVNIEGNEGLDPYNIDYCPGTAPTISLNSYGYDTEGNLIQEHGVYYDWYFGTKEQFKHEYVWLDNTEIDVDNLANYTQSEIITAEDFCMEHCLMNFRHFYPNAGVKELYDSTIVRVHHFEKDPVTEAEYELTAKMIAKLKEWVEVGKLRLHLTAVSVDLSASKGEELTHVLAIQQGAKLRYDPADVSKDNPIIYCMDPVEISFYTNLESPAATVGLNGVDYSITPYDNVIGSQDVFYSIPLRINKTQIKDIAQNESTTLQVPLRVITPSGYYKVDDGEGLVNCDNIHLEVDPMDNFVYVVETNDPQWEMHDINGDGVQYLPYVGRLISIDANKKRAEGVNTLKIVFNDESINMDRKFVPREGYYYILRTQFNEELNPGVELAPEYEVPDIKCKGNILIPLKVVPEYVKWTGRESNEWNNDRNWIRADYHELVPSKLQNPNNEYADYYVNFSDSVMADSDAVYNGLPLSANDEKAAADFDIYIPMDQPSASDLYNTFAYAPMAQTSVIIPTGAVRYPSLTTHQRSTQAGKIGLLDIDHSAEVSTPWIEYDMVAVPNATGYTADAYYENTIKDITFAPATQMGNAHMLSYKKAWVEYELNAERWYTLGSPLKNSFSGDWYAPTNGSKQLSPLFRDIKYVQGVNDRFRPAFFQRSWDLKGSNIVYLKAGGTQESYVKAEWSNVYNDAKVPYTEGGFSVKPELGYITPITLRPADGKVLVRMPKADQSYTYYDINGQTGAANAQIGARTNRLQTDDLGANGAGAINMTITNQTAGNEYFLVSNPFMSPMDMTAFFAANSDNLEAKYWIVDNDHQMVSIKDAATDEWITTSSTDGQYVAPLQGFFVKSTAGSKTLSVTYTAAMQGLQASAPLLRSKAFADNGIETIEIIAERDGKESKALVAIAEGADNGFVSEEDCETFLDGNLADQPAVYTSADGQALTINVVEELSLIPLGVISSDSSDVSISIKSTMAQPLYLYDKQAATVSPIASSTKLTIRANNAGRYFICTSEIIPADDELPTTTSARGVWTVGGVYCGETIQGVAPGVYVVDGVKTVVR